MIARSSLIPNYIEASSPKALRLLMLETNNKSNVQNTYFDIGSYTKYDGKGNGRLRWIAWYYTDFKIGEVMDD